MKYESFKIRATLLDRVRRLARQGHRSYTAQAELLIEEALARSESTTA